MPVHTHPWGSSWVPGIIIYAQSLCLSVCAAGEDEIAGESDQKPQLLREALGKTDAGL